MTRKPDPEADDLEALLSQDANSPKLSDSNPHPKIVETPKLPVPLCVWRILIIIGVLIYSSYTIFVHLCEEGGKLPFSSSAVVFLIELTKLVLSIGMFISETKPCLSGSSSSSSSSFNQTSRTQQGKIMLGGLKNLWQALKDEFRLAQNSNPSSRQSPNNRQSLSFVSLCLIIVPFTIPAVLYAINNNLAIHIQLEMDPATYQVLGNFKILSTGILFRLIIKKPLSYLQWFALTLLLLAGIVHSYGNMDLHKPTSVTTTTTTLATPINLTSASLHITALGLMMIFFYCTISGLSGVYTEYVLKTRAKMSINVQNAMLYIFGVILNGLAFVVDVNHSSDSAKSYDLFRGFTLWTWLLVITQALGGIFMGYIMKYANNITRLFIISSAMLITTVLSMIIFGLTLNYYFLISVILVTLAIFLYHR